MPDDAPPNFLLEPTPHDEAEKWIQDKPPVSKAVFNAMLPELRARAFLVSGIEDANVAAEVRDIIAKLPAGESWEKTKKELVSKLGPWLSSDDPENKVAKARAELLLRTHGFQAYQVAQHRVMREQEDVFPYWQYLTLDDEKVRPGHSALNFKVAPANAPFWHDHSPPWQWGCRCRKVPILPDEMEEMQAEDAKLPPEQHRVLSPAGLKLAEQGRIYNKAGQQLDIKSDRQKGKTDGFVFDPDALTLPLSSLKGRYDPTTWGEFEQGMKAAKLDDGRTVWGWMDGEVAPNAKAGAQPEPKPAPTPPPEAKPEPKVTDETAKPADPPRPAEPVSQVKVTEKRTSSAVGKNNLPKTKAGVKPYMTPAEIEDAAIEQVNRMTVEQLREEALAHAKKLNLSKSMQEAIARSRGKGEARSRAIQARMTAIRAESEAMQREVARQRGKTDSAANDDSDLATPRP